MTESSDEILAKRQAKLGTEFGSVFHGLWNEWAWALMRRDEFRVLFTEAKDVALLNALTGGAFTWDIQTIFWDDLLLRVCRLTDPPKTGSKRNLSVRQLPLFCESHGSTLIQKVQNLTDVAVERADFARQWRNRRISHSDYERVVHKANPLPPASLKKLTIALDAVHAVLNAISAELLNSNIANEQIGQPRAQAFLSYAGRLVDSVKFIEAIAVPNVEQRRADNDIAEKFLDRLRVERTTPNIRLVRNLLQMARRFN